MIKPAPIQPILNSRHRISGSVLKFSAFAIKFSSRTRRLRRPILLHFSIEVLLTVCIDDSTLKTGSQTDTKRLFKSSLAARKSARRCALRVIFADWCTWCTTKRARYSLRLPRHLAILNPHRALRDRLGRPVRSGRYLASLDTPPAGRKSFRRLARGSTPR